MVKVWRIQGTTNKEEHPSWDSFQAVEPEEPAAEWPGFWWARGLEYWNRYTYFLIREHDVERARAGHAVEVFVPGLYGCEEPGELLWYIESSVGGVLENDDLYVALYEGDVIDRADDGVVFRPVELLEVWYANVWYQTQKQEARERE